MRQDHFVVRPVRGDMVWIDDLVELLQVMRDEARVFEESQRNRQLVFHIPDGLPDVQAWDAELDAMVAVVAAARAYVSALDEARPIVPEWRALRDAVMFLDGVQGRYARNGGDDHGDK